MNWLSFANPMFLAGLAAVGLPVLIHYLTRARPRRIAFPPFRYLLEACAGQQAVHRLRTIVLLALRCLAVFALVFLFARPFLKPSAASAGPETARRVVLVVDASLSMRAVQQGVPLFSRAQSEATDLLRSLDSGAEAGVILAGARPRPILPALSRNLPALHDELVKATATFENGDPAAALALAEKMLGGRGTLYVFSDFQKSNWEIARELPAGIECRLRPMNRAPVDNVALTGARCVPAQPVIGEPGEIVATVFNCTARPREETVRLELGDSTRELRVRLAPFGTAEAAFPVTFTRVGALAGKVTLQPDDLPEDNTRYLALDVGKALQILLVSDAESGDAHSAAFYISRALAPSPQVAPGLNIVRRHSQDADRGILETADVFVLVAPAMLTGEAVEIISRRLNDGARMMAFLDGPTAPMLLPATFNPPFSLSRMVVSTNGDAIDGGTRRLFAETDRTDFAAARFYRHYQTQVRDGAAGEVFFSYTDGSVAMASSRVGRGTAVFANIPLTPDAGNFIGSPMFPSLLHELLRTLRLGADERAVSPGAGWTIDVPTAGDAPLVVVDPQSRPVDAQVLSSGRITRLALPAARVPGVYVIRQSDATVAASAVNIDPRESDTRPIALEQLKVAGGKGVSIARDEDDLLIAGMTQPLWPHFAAAAAVFLMLEMLLLAVWRSPASRRNGARSEIAAPATGVPLAERALGAETIGAEAGKREAAL